MRKKNRRFHYYTYTPPLMSQHYSYTPPLAMYTRTTHVTDVAFGAAVITHFLINARADRFSSFFSLLFFFFFTAKNPSDIRYPSPPPPRPSGQSVLFVYRRRRSQTFLTCYMRPPATRWLGPLRIIIRGNIYIIKIPVECLTRTILFLLDSEGRGLL